MILVIERHFGACTGTVDVMVVVVNNVVDSDIEKGM